MLDRTHQIPNYTYTYVADLKSSVRQQGVRAFCTETKTEYMFENNGSSYTPNDKDVLTTGAGGSIIFTKNQKIKPGKDFELYSSTAYIAYSTEQPINYIRLTITHEATDNHEMEFVLKIHR